MPVITLPDGSQRNFDQPVTVAEVAASIGAGLARAALDLGFFISFSGIVTFRNAEDLRQVARFVPLDRLLIETDSPYLAPVPFRGKTNQPAYVAHVGAAVAALRGITPEALASATSTNFERLFEVKAA